MLDFPRLSCETHANEYPILCLAQMQTLGTYREGVQQMLVNK